MKCINCGTNNSYRDRSSNYGRCKNCGYQIVFEPIIMTPKITDGRFEKIINDISLNNTIFYTQNSKTV